MSRWLTIDVGTTALKAAVVDDRGRVGQVVNEPYPLHSPHPGWAEQEPDEWWAACCRAVSRLDSTETSTVDGIAVTGQMQDLILVADGRTTGPAVLYSDQRAGAETEELSARFPQWSSIIGAPIDATNVAAKWQWMATHRPDLAAAAQSVMFGGHSAVVLAMTGQAVCDPTTAATTGLYDIAASSWWTPLVEAIGIPVPRLVQPSDVVGVLGADAAEMLGLRTGTPVVHGPGDAVAATIGVLGSEVGRSYVSVGTSGWVAHVNAERGTTPAIWLPGLHAQHWVVAAPLLTAGGAIDWVRSALLGGCSSAEFETLATSGCAAADGVMFIPHLDGVRFPRPDSEATGVLVGARRSTSAATIAAAALEGVAQAIRSAASAIGPIGSSIALCGGLSESDQFSGVLADVLGTMVERVAGDDATLRGAWVAAAASAGRVDAAAVVDTLMPDPSRHALHRRGAIIFDDLLERLAPIFIKLGRQRADGLQIELQR